MVGENKYIRSMIIIADSGSSKIDWRLLRTDGKIDQAQCAGFNPYYQPIEDLRKISGSACSCSNGECDEDFFLWNGGLLKEKSGFSSGDVPRIFSESRSGN